MPRHNAAIVLLFAAVAAAAALALPARAASEEELALLRVSAAAELTLATYYLRAASSGRFVPAERRRLRAWRKGSQRSYSELVRAIGADAPTRADVQIAFPRSAFASRKAALRLGSTLERTAAGVGAHAAARIGDEPLRRLAARLATTHSVRAGALAAVGGLTVTVPRPLDEEAATAALGRYWR